ncbi:MAG: FtsW/RodA/SpoVE family cell cycle protein [Planctomycetota bacterium]
MTDVRPWSWKGLRPRTGLRSMLGTDVPWARVDWLLLILAGGLVGLGLVLVRTMADADLEYGREGVEYASHLKKLVVALPFLVLGFFLRARWLRNNAVLVWLICMLLLAAVPFVGVERNNARRWIPLGAFDLQPSELAKVGLIIALAGAFYRNRLVTLRDWLKPGLFALLPMILVAEQPDLGTALTIVPLTLGMGWLAGGRAGTIVGIVATGALVATLAWQFSWVEDYQKKRIDVWAACFDNDVLIANRSGAAFHTYQSRLAIGNGGFEGRGLGRGVANEGGHLPERESDSVFAVIAEELGYVGTMAFVAYYLVFALLLLLAAAGIRERFSRLLVGGVGLYFLVHFFIHAGVNLGLVPMTGLTLPLISTGGSSLLASFAALGIAVGHAARQEPTLDRDAFRT